MQNPIISIIIPVKNGEATISQCLDSIKSQTIFDQTEIIIIDSGSTDNTLDILKKYSFIRLYHIPPEEFNHGSTRNYGVSLAKGEFVVMTVQDARAANQFWLEKMLKHFSDKEIASVTGQQVVPHEKDKNPHQWFRPQSETSVHSYQFNSKEKFNQLKPEEQYFYCRVDDVNTMYRKSILQKTPFHTMPFGEDLQWAKDAYKKGYKLAFDNHAQVFHYHHQYYSYSFNINYTLNLYQYKIFNLLPSKSIKMKDFLYIAYLNFKYRAKPKWIFFNLKILWAKYKASKRFFKQLELKNINYSQNIPQGKQNI